ncbi:MAG: hypothetical protein ACRDDX_14800 [Cellulosilyticaceae bacterium]
MKKQFGKYVLVACMASATTLIAATPTISAILKKQEINYEGNVSTKEVVSYNNTTYVPLREFSKLVGIPVDYKNGIIYLGDNTSSSYDYNNPAPIGTKQVTTGWHPDIGTYTVELEVKEVTRGKEAFELIEKQNKPMASLRDGEEFLIVKVSIKMLNSEKAGSIRVIADNLMYSSENNTQYVQDVSTYVPAPKLDSMLMKGASTEGNIILHVNKDDKAPKLAWRMLGSKTVSEGKWFSLKK